MDTVGTTKTLIATVQNTLHVRYQPIEASISVVDYTRRIGFDYAPQYTYIAVSQFVWQHVPGNTKYHFTLHKNGNNNRPFADGYTFIGDSQTFVLQPIDYWYEVGMAAWRPKDSGWIDSPVLQSENDSGWVATKRAAKQAVTDATKGWTVTIVPYQ